jgi:hypothetical protein
VCTGFMREKGAITVRDGFPFRGGRFEWMDCRS